MRRHIARLTRCSRGATAIEYGLIITCIALAIVGGATLLGQSVSNLWGSVGNSYTAAVG